MSLFVNIDYTQYEDCKKFVITPLIDFPIIMDNIN